jgi:hypothetical protein
MARSDHCVTIDTGAGSSSSRSVERGRWGPRPTPAGQRKGEFRRRSTAPPPADPGVDPLGRRVSYGFRRRLGGGRLGRGGLGQFGGGGGAEDDVLDALEGGDAGLLGGFDLDRFARDSRPRPPDRSCWRVRPGTVRATGLLRLDQPTRRGDPTWTDWTALRAARMT